MGFTKRYNITLNQLRKIYHGHYWGGQDVVFETLDKHSNKPKIGKLRETKTVTLPISHCLYYTLYSVDTHKYEPNVGYTNFNIHSSMKSIHSVELHVGGQQFGQSYLFKYVENIPVIDLLNEPKCLPQLEKHNIAIRIDFNEPVPNDTITFSYDIVEIENPQKSYEYLLCQEQYTGGEILGDETQKLIRLHFNNAIVRLYAFLPENTVDARLILNNDDHDLIFTKVKGTNYHILEFGYYTTLNFSRIDNTSVWITTKTPNPEFPVHIHAISKQIVRCIDGRAGFAYPI